MQLKPENTVTLSRSNGENANIRCGTLVMILDKLANKHGLSGTRKIKGTNHYVPQTTARVENFIEALQRVGKQTKADYQDVKDTPENRQKISSTLSQIRSAIKDAGNWTIGNQDFSVDSVVYFSKGKRSTVLSEEEQKQAAEEFDALNSVEI